MDSSATDPIAARRGDADWLSLALIDARNHTLRWLTAFDAAGSARAEPEGGVVTPLWLAARAGWWSEYWITRNVQSQRGEACDTTLPRLASIEPAIAGVFDAVVDHDLALPDIGTVRAYLAESLEAVLELMQRAGDDDAALYFYRLALLHEDRIGEVLAAAAQSAGLKDAPWLAQPSRVEREALWLPAQRFELGARRGGLVCANERWAHDVTLPECEIDAQAVSWARYVEFADDGGYDESHWWSDRGWAWAQQTQRRAPRYVEQVRGGVIVQRQGQLQRVGAHQAAVHVSRHEAQAWCAWAGRRLPTEVEWELAACTATSRGFVCGDVIEWVAGSARGWPGYTPLPGDLDPLFDGAAVQRGASWMSPPRLLQPKQRRFVAPQADAVFGGFRSCAR